MGYTSRQAVCSNAQKRSYGGNTGLGESVPNPHSTGDTRLGPNSQRYCWRSRARVWRARFPTTRPKSAACRRPARPLDALDNGGITLSPQGAHENAKRLGRGGATSQHGFLAQALHFFVRVLFFCQGLAVRVVAIKGANVGIRNQGTFQMKATVGDETNNGVTFLIATRFVGVQTGGGTSQDFSRRQRLGLGKETSYPLACSIPRAWTKA
jgi:hypothetical protein